MQSQTCRILTFPTFNDPRGSLTAVEGEKQTPFEIKRFYYVYGVPDLAHRGGHAHRHEEEVVIPIHGQFSVKVDDGCYRREFHLDCAARGLYIPPLVWHDLYGFSPGAVCAVLASQPFDPLDYYTDHEVFLGVMKRLRLLRARGGSHPEEESALASR